MIDSLDELKNTEEPWASLEYNLREGLRLVEMQSSRGLVYLKMALAIVITQAEEGEGKSR